MKAYFFEFKSDAKSVILENVSMRREGGFISFTDPDRDLLLEVAASEINGPWPYPRVILDDLVSE